VVTHLAGPTIIVYETFMSPSTKIVHEIKKKRGPGRPRAGVEIAEAITTRIPGELLARVTEWAADNRVTRSDAIARLLAQALDSQKASRKR
jgi:hypothetical protein